MSEQHFDTKERNANDSLNSPLYIIEVGQGHEGINTNSTFLVLNSYYISISFKKVVGRV